MWSYFTPIFSSINRRMGGLEKQKAALMVERQINRRMGGLETHHPQHKLQHQINRRMGGLEKNQVDKNNLPYY